MPGVDTSSHCCAEVRACDKECCVPSGDSRSKKIVLGAVDAARFLIGEDGLKNAAIHFN